MSLYPATTPVTPSTDVYGLPDISGATKLTIYREGIPTTADEIKSYNPKYALLISPLITVTDQPEDLDAYNPELSLYYFKAAQAILLLLQHCAYSNIAYSSTVLAGGINCVNFGTKWQFYGSISGSTVTITDEMSGYDNPRSLSALVQYKPAWDTESGEAESSYSSISITPGRFEIRVDSDGYLGRAKVKSISSAAGTTTLTLSNPLPTVTDGTIYAWAEVGDPFLSQDFHLERRLWTSRKDSGWISTADIDALTPADVVELTTVAGGHGKIAVPYSGAPRNWLTVYSSDSVAEPSAATGADITTYFTSTIATAGSKLAITESGGVWTTKLLLDKHLTDTDIKWYRVIYYPQDSAADAPSDLTIMPRTLYSCAYCKRDWSNSLASCSVPWGATDGSSNHWYCSKAGEADVDTSEFNSECENLACPQYSTMSAHRGWAYSAAHHSQLMFAKNIYGLRPIPGVDDVYIGRGGGKFPSLTWLMGQREVHLTGYDLELQTRAVGDHALYGKLIDTVEGDDDYPYKVLIPGAVKAATADTDGLLWDSGATVCGDPLGSSATDGTYYANWLRQFRGMRNAGSHGIWADDALGDLYEPVQRLCNRQVVLRGINVTPSMVGITQTFYGGHTAMLASDLSLSIRLARERSLERNIPEDASYVHTGNLAGDLLTLDMSPYVERALYVSDGEDVEMEYLTSGGAVDPMEWQKPTNPSTWGQMMNYGHNNTIQKGDVIRIYNTTAPYDSYWAFVLAVDSRGGSTYSGVINGVSSATTPSGSGFPTDFEDYRLKCDRLYVWLGGFKGQLLKAWITAGGIPASRTYRISAWSRAALAPDYEIASKALQAATKTLNIWHTPVTAGVLGTVEEITTYEKDAANSEIMVDASGWTGTDTHNICVRGQFLDMRNLYPAEIITGLREAVQECKTFEAVYSGSGFAATLVDSGSAAPALNVDGTPNWTWSSAADLIPVNAGALHWERADIGSITEYKVGWAGYPEASVYPFEGQHTAAITGFYGLNYLKADWISEAWLNVTLDTPELMETISDSENPESDGTTYLDVSLADLSVSAAIITFDESGEITAVSVPTVSPTFNLMDMGDGTFKATVNVTDLIKYLMTNPIGDGQVYGFVVHGSNAAAEDTNDFAGAWMETHGQINGSGTGYETYYHRCRVMTYQGLGFGSLYVTLDMTEIENDGLECPPEFFPPMS